jgi:hypothetical protein
LLLVLNADFAIFFYFPLGLLVQGAEVASALKRGDQFFGVAFGSLHKPIRLIGEVAVWRWRWQMWKPRAESK